MAPTPRRARSPIHLYLDFDSTLTTASTLGILVSNARAFNPRPTAESAISELTAAYTADRRAHDTAYPAPQSQRTTLGDELRYEASLQAVERASVERVEKTGAFARVPSAEDMAGLGEMAVREGHVRMREGWEELLHSALDDDEGLPGACVTVLSVSWSRAWIRGCLHEAAVVAEHARNRASALNSSHAGAFDILRYVDRIKIIANEVDWLEPPGGNLDRRWREEDRGIWTGIDKRQAMREEESVSRLSESNDLRPRTVYVGDSPTDLACLVEADVGICMRGRKGQDAPSEAGDLQQLLARVGVECLHVSDYGHSSRGIQTTNELAITNTGEVSDGRNETKQARVWWASDFDEILRSPTFVHGTGSLEKD